MAKSIASQLQALEKEIALKSKKYQEQLNKTPKEKWFTKEFMRSIHFSVSIQELFNKAGVETTINVPNANRTASIAASIFFILLVILKS